MSLLSSSSSTVLPSLESPIHSAILLIVKKRKDCFCSWILVPDECNSFCWKLNFSLPIQFLLLITIIPAAYPNSFTFRKKQKETEKEWKYFENKIENKRETLKKHIGRCMIYLKKYFHFFLIKREQLESSCMLSYTSLTFNASCEC